MQRRETGQALFTIGYQGHTIQSIVRTLKANNIDLLVDVRQNPVSRKPGFSKRRLDERLTSIGIDYVHFPCLGTPPSIRRFYNEGGEVQAALHRYEQYLLTKRSCLDSLADAATGHRCCLLCLESCYNACHRGVIARQLALMTQWTPVHLT